VEDCQQRADVEVCEVNGVSDAVVEWCCAVFQQSHHFGVNGSQHDQSAADLAGDSGQSINTGLEKRAEFFVAAAIEVLEFIEDQDVASAGHGFQQPCELQQVLRAGKPIWRHLEHIERIVDGGEQSGGKCVGDLQVEDGLSVAEQLDGVADECGFADASSSGDFGEEPAFAAEHELQFGEQLRASVELPVHDGYL